MSRAVTLVLMLASLGFVAQASRDTMSASGVQARKLSTTQRCVPPECNPFDFPCVYWENPCPSLLPLLPATMECGTCVNPVTFDVEVKGPCPTTACASTYATAISQNGGCARVSSTALASSGGQAVWDSATEEASSYVEGFISGEMEMEASAYGFTMAMARACSHALAKYFQGACFCCSKTEFFQGGAFADSASVAMALSQASVKAFATVNATYPIFVQNVTQYIASGADSNVFAADIKRTMAAVLGQFTGTPDGVEYAYLGFPTVWRTYLGTTQCWSIKSSDYVSAVAKAMTCTVVSAFSKIYLDPAYQNNGTAETYASACSRSIAVSGFASGPADEFFETCNIDCPCGVNYEQSIFDHVYLEGVCKANEQCARVADTATFGCHCNPGLTKCTAGCMNLQKDEDNCGACGNKCGSSQYCHNGVCTCYWGTMCGTTCRTTSSDNQHCGACGNVCPTSHPWCSSGACVCSSSSTCPTGFTCQSRACKCGVNGPTSCLSGQTCSGRSVFGKTVYACR